MADPWTWAFVIASVAKQSSDEHNAQREEQHARRVARANAAEAQRATDAEIKQAKKEGAAVVGQQKAVAGMTNLSAGSFDDVVMAEKQRTIDETRDIQAAGEKKRDSFLYKAKRSKKRSGQMRTSLIAGIAATIASGGMAASGGGGGIGSVAPSNGGPTGGSLGGTPR